MTHYSESWKSSAAPTETPEAGNPMAAHQGYAFHTPSITVHVGSPPQSPSNLPRDVGWSISYSAPTLEDAFAFIEAARKRLGPISEP